MKILNSYFECSKTKKESYFKFYKKIIKLK